MSKNKHVSEAEFKSVETIVESNPVRAVLNEGQQLQVLGRVRSGMTQEEARDFVLSKKPRVGLSDEAIAYRAKYPKKFGKLDANGNVAPPSAEKIAYLKSIEQASKK